MIERRKRTGDSLLAWGFTLMAAWSGPAAVAEIIHGLPHWWSWAIIALFGTRLAWVCFRDAGNPAKPVATAI